MQIKVTLPDDFITKLANEIGRIVLHTPVAAPQETEAEKEERVEEEPPFETNGKHMSFDDFKSQVVGHVQACKDKAVVRELIQKYAPSLDAVKADDYQEILSKLQAAV